VSRQYPTRPIPAVGVVVLRGEEVLLIRRGRAPQKGGWSLPGGAQKLGETVRETALREVREETGLSVRLAGLIDVVDSLTPDGDGKPEYHYTLVDFAAHWVAGEAEAGGDAAEVRWVPADSLDDYDLWSETRRVIALARELCAAPGGR
jgi:ADP-ribose pyrophosphatase YjhB (NUDIX family)